jgi:TonB family protein
VDPAELEALIASLGVFTADQVERPAMLDSASLPAIAYPPALRAAGTSGVVVAEFVVDSAGQMEAEYFGAVSATDPLFTAAVREALKSARFQPAVRRGRAVRQIVRLPFEFTAPGRAGGRN